jgi:dephospho-CoA kinase
MIKVGITGNIGAGKSYIGKLLLELGAYVYSMDDHIKFLEEYDPWLKENIEHHFGNDIYTEEGLNRKKLADIIFNDDNKLKLIEDMIKGPGLCDLFNTAFQLEHIAKYKLMFVENAVMFKTSMHKYMDHMLLINAPLELRLKRVTELRGMSKEDFMRRNDIQPNINQMKAYCYEADVPFTTIDNSADVEEVRSIIKETYYNFKNHGI